MLRHCLKIQEFILWPFNEKLLCFKAFHWLLWSSFALRFIPFKKLTISLGKEMLESSITGEEQNIVEIQNLAKAIERARMFAPWRPKCYPQAIAAKLMLNHRNIPATLYVGVWKKEKEFRAHAWTRSQNIILTGGKVAADYTVLATYS